MTRPRHDPDPLLAARPETLLRTTAQIVVAGVAALLLGSTALQDWAAGLPVNQVSDALVAMADGWQDWMGAIGLEAPAQYLRALARTLKAWRW